MCRRQKGEEEGRRLVENSLSAERGERCLNSVNCRCDLEMVSQEALKMDGNIRRKSTRTGGGDRRLAGTYFPGSSPILVGSIRGRNPLILRCRHRKLVER